MKKLTVEEKFAKAIIRLRGIRPFYSAIYEATEKVEVNYIDTMGVTADKLIYNYKFVDKISFEQFMFVVLHEIAHIALMHVVRMEHRDMNIWNIACDLFVNKLIADEFRVMPGQINHNAGIEMGKEVVFSSVVDLEEDIVEELYEFIKKQLDKQDYFSNTAEGEGDNTSYKVQLHPKSGDTLTIHKKMYVDMINDGSDYHQQEDRCRKIIVDAKTRSEMMKSGIGNTAGKLEEMVEKLLQSKVDWKKLLRKYCIQYRTKDTSFSSPDRRMYYQDAIYPGINAENAEAIKNVKVCIDTSGSISQEDLGHFFTQILQLVKSFKTTVEVLNWDTEIEQSYMLDSDNVVTSNKKYTVVGRGGTDPTCLFEYFDSKKCKVKPFVTLIFTDGYIGFTCNPKWPKKYKNTIWIMTKDYNKDFKPDFGKIAHAQFSD